MIHRQIRFYLRIKEFCLAAAVSAGALAFGTANAAGEGQPEFPRDDVDFYKLEVKPILEENCFKCHGKGDRLRAHFDLTSRAGLMLGGDLGPAFNPDEPARSFLLEMISYKDDHHQMPPDGKLPDEEIAVLTRWITSNAPYAPEEMGDLEALKKERRGGKRFTDKDKSWWAFQPLERPEVPEVPNEEWSRNPIDAFIHDRLAKNGLSPNGKADKLTLIRRAYYNLLGLPPQPEAVRAFLADESPDAWENLIDELLESPHYGEKWGRHWLDLVRWAETNGYERDSRKPEAWRYRDYVIESFIQDKPYDRFLMEQLAGDELPDADGESITATGYYRLGVWDDEPADRKLARYEYLDDIVKTTSEAMMGMTVACARCHDHKIDPILAKDYYSMLSFFQEITPHGKGDAITREIPDPDAGERYEKALAEKQERMDALHARIFEIKEQFREELARKRPEIAGSGFGVSDMTDVRYRFYRDTFEELPDFNNIRHETEGRLAHGFFSLEPASRQEAIGFVWVAQLRAPRTGDYSFTLESDDKARLIVDGKTVVETDGSTATGTTVLAGGMRSIRLEYIHGMGEFKLSASWSGPDFEDKPLSLSEGGGEIIFSDARNREQGWKYAVEEPEGDWTGVGYNDRDWKTGSAGFGTEGAPGAVVRTNWSTSDLWLRKDFGLQKLPDELTLVVHHDEDATIYLNGQKVIELDGYVQDYREISLPDEALGALQTGKNVVAVHVRHSAGGQYFDMGLQTGEAKLEMSQLLRRYGEEILGRRDLRRLHRFERELQEVREEEIDAGGVEVMAVAETGKVTQTYVMPRGNPHVQGEPVDPRFLEILGGEKPEFSPRNGSSGKRYALAKWLTREDNPLTSRVFMNRVWQHHFGRGIVRSTNDFGQIGTLPTHPDLLDWLAVEFVEGGWKLKRMHKLIMMSQAYQMSSDGDSYSINKDPANDYFWRFNMRRLSAEEVRDSMLALTGKLNLEMGGPSFYPELPQAIIQTSSKAQNIYNGFWGRSPQEERDRRSIYIFVRRSLLDPLLKSFDLADTDSSCPVRFTTTVPTQSLTMMNGEFTNKQAERFADRLREEAPSDLSAQVRRGLSLAFCRRVTDEEVQAGLGMIADLAAEPDVTEEQALDLFCLMVINLNEFIFLD